MPSPSKGNPDRTSPPAPMKQCVPRRVSNQQLQFRKRLHIRAVSLKQFHQRCKI